MAVTVETLLRDLSDSRALPVELIAGAGGLGRAITISQPQKTGLALTGFDAYLHGGRVLVFGESEVRYVESLDPAPRA
jgi:HPr kinase/phosphorylase